MSTDASYQLTTQKFSFIEQIDYSCSVNKTQIQQKSDSIQSKQSQLANLSSTANLSLPGLTLYSNFIGGNSDLAYDFNFEPELEFSTAINNSQNNKFPFDKILFALSCIYVMGVSGWVLYQHRGQFPWLFARLDHTRQVSAEELQFLDYLERSLEIIDRKTQTAQISETKSEPSTLVYVPVYTPSPASVVPPQPVLSPPVAQIVPPPPPESLPPPPPPTTATQTASPPSAIAPPEAPVATASTSVHGYVLIGLLELGAKSTALFEIDGVTKRIGLGETIEDTGWILRSISNQQVNISFQNENRSLSIGEKF